MKKRLLLLLCLIATAGSSAWAEIAHGSKNGFAWSIDDNGKLTVNFTTTIHNDFYMPDYGEGKAPWYKYRDRITSIHIGSRCLSVGRNAFFKLDSVSEVTGGENVRSIAIGGFDCCGDGVKPIPFLSFPKCDYVGEYAFYLTTVRSISLPSVETYKKFAVDLSGRYGLIDLGDKVKMLRAGSMSGCKYIFIQSPTPPDWERHYKYDPGIFDAEEDRYDYPFDVFDDFRYPCVVVPKEYLQTYIDFYPKNHPEVETGYMCANFKDEHKRGAPTHPQGKLFAGAPIYKDGILIGGWYVEDSELYVVLNTETMPTFGDNVPWKSVLGSVEKMTITYSGSRDKITDLRFTIPDNCFAPSALMGIKELTFLHIPYVIIGDYAFRNCEDLEALSFSGVPEKLYTTIITICKIGRGAFQGCKNLKSLSGIAGNGGFTCLHIYDLGEECFDGCQSLNIYDEECRHLFLAPKEIPYGAFRGCESLEKMHFENIKKIDAEAFYHAGLKSAKISNIQYIGQEAFAYSNIQEVHLKPEGMVIENEAFSNCTQLEHIFVYSGVSGATICDDIFNGIDLQNLTLQVKGEYYGGYANSPLWGEMRVSKGVLLPVSKMWGSIDENGLLKVEQFSSDLHQPWYDFKSLITSVDLTRLYGYNLSIPDNAFADYDNLEEVTITRQFREIGSRAFKGCTKLKEINLPNICIIGDQAFEGCSSLYYVDLGENLEKAGDYIFRNCTNLHYIGNKDNTPAAVTDYTFAEIGSEKYPESPSGRRRAASYNGQSAITLKVDDEHVTNYIIDKNWGKFHIHFADGRGTWETAGRYGDGTWILYTDGTMVVAADKGPGDNYYDSYPDCLGFTNEVKEKTKRVEFAGNITAIGPSFQNFKNLVSVSLSPSIQTLNGTFFGCRNLQDINIENIDTIGSSTFGYTPFQELNLRNVKWIDTYAFYNCDELLMATLGDQCTLKKGVFFDCDKFTLANLGKANLDKAERCFGSCDKLKIGVFNGKSLPEEMFSSCKSLVTMKIGENVERILDEFEGCPALDTIYCDSPTPPELPIYEKVHYLGEVDYEIVDARAFDGVDVSKIKLVLNPEYIPLYRKMEVWKDMQIIADNDNYVDPVLPTGGAIGLDGLWSIDAEGVLTIDYNGNFYAKNSDGTTWHDLFYPYTPFITKVVATDNVKQLPIDMMGEHNPIVSEDVKAVELGMRMQTLCNGSLNYSGLTDVYCYALNCPRVDNSAFDWEAIQKNNATLHVVNQPGVADCYRNSKQWSKFPNIVADLESRLPAGVFRSLTDEGLYVWYHITDEAAKTCETYPRNFLDGGSAVERNAYTQYDKLTIPATVQYNGSTYTVTGIGDNSFRGCTNFGNFILPETIETIGSYAFASNNGMHIADFTLPASVKFIAENAFDMWTGLRRLTVLGQEPPVTDDNAINTYWDPYVAPHPILLVPDGTKDAWNVAPWNLWFTVIDKDNPNTLTYKVKPGAYFNDYYKNDEEYMCIEALMRVGELTYENEVVGRVWDPLIEMWDEIYGDVYYNKAHKKLFYLDESGYIKLYEGVSPADNIHYTFKQSDYDEMAYTAGENIRLFKDAAIIFPETNVQTDIYFTARNEDGIDITYRVLDPVKKTCEVKGDPNGDNYPLAVPGYVSEVKIPFSANGYIVTGIAADAFSSMTDLQSIALPTSILTIGDRAFSYCTNVLDVTINCVNPPILLDQDGFLTTENNYAFQDIGGEEDAEGERFSATLYVPYGSEEAYNVYPWNYWFCSSIAPDPDAIKGLNDSKDFKDSWFDLSGRKLTGKPAQPGLYINNGKKVVIK